MNEPANKTPEMTAPEQAPRRPFVFWLKRLGLAGFLFYLIKGLLWVIIPALVAKGCL